MPTRPCLPVRRAGPARQGGWRCLSPKLSWRRLWAWLSLILAFSSCAKPCEAQGQPVSGVTSASGNRRLAMEASPRAQPAAGGGEQDAGAAGSVEGGHASGGQLAAGSADADVQAAGSSGAGAAGGGSAAGGGAAARESSVGLEGSEQQPPNKRPRVAELAGPRGANSPALPPFLTAYPTAATAVGGGGVPTPALVADPALVGTPLTGSVDAAFDGGYFVTLQLGEQHFKGEGAAPHCHCLLRTTSEGHVFWVRFLVFLRAPPLLRCRSP